MENVLNRRTFIALAGGLTAGCGVFRQGKPFYGSAFIANQDAHSLAVLQLWDFQVGTTIPLPGAPTAAIPHQRRNAVYVLAPEAGEVYEIDGTSRTLRRKVALKGQLYSMLLEPEPGDRSLWVTSREERCLYRVGLESFQQEARYALSGDPLDFDITQYYQQNQWHHAAVMSYGKAGAVGILHWQTGEPERRVDLHSEAGTVRFQGNGAQVVVALTNDRALAILRTYDGAVVTQLPLAIRPENFTSKTDGGEIYVTGEGADAVVVVQPYQTQIAATVLAGSSPGAMAASPDYLFVANPLAGVVSIMDIETRHVGSIARVGRQPAFITITPNLQFALVLNRMSGDVSVIRIPDIKMGKFKPGSLCAMVSVGSKPVSAAVLSEARA